MYLLILLPLSCTLDTILEPEEPVGGGLRQIELPAGVTPEPVDTGAPAVADAALPGEEPAEGVTPDPGPPPLEDPGEERWAEYRDPVTKPLLAAQPWRTTSELPFVLPGGRAGTARLTNVNPRLNRWFSLELDWADGGTDRYHLESNLPEIQVMLDERNPTGLVFVRGENAFACGLWPQIPEPPLATAQAAGTPYVDLCEGLISLRNPTEGRKSTKEWASDFLRDNVWGGEEITVFIRDTFFSGSFAQTEGVEEASGFRVAPSRQVYKIPDAPLLDPEHEGATIERGALTLPIQNPDPDRMEVGRWYPLNGQRGIYVSALQAGLVHPDVIAAQEGLVNPLDNTESAARVVMVAFDLDQFELEYALGTDHPRLDWSSRIPAGVVDAARPGPDGFAAPDPLVRTGKIHRRDFERLAAAFTGGFKRSHGAFKHTELSTSNDGSHYGFIENGVVFSRLNPGLATAIVWDDGAVEFKTWTDEDESEIGRIRHARQNGVPLLAPDPETGEVAPGSLVKRWGEGNWSGSVDGKLVSLRGGLCLQTREDRQFLIYGWFTGATPSGMARVFAAAGCDYAMLTDMNALEHTYLATYEQEGQDFQVFHVDSGMDVLDKSRSGVTLPRFVAFADNRDFFYLLRKEDQ